MHKAKLKVRHIIPKCTHKWVYESFHLTIEIIDEIKNRDIDSLIIRQIEAHCNGNNISK